MRLFRWRTRIEQPPSSACDTVRDLANPHLETTEEMKKLGCEYNSDVRFLTNVGLAAHGLIFTFLGIVLSSEKQILNASAFRDLGIGATESNVLILRIVALGFCGFVMLKIAYAGKQAEFRAAGYLNFDVRENLRRRIVKYSAHKPCVFHSEFFLPPALLYFGFAIASAVVLCRRI